MTDTRDLVVVQEAVVGVGQYLAFITQTGPDEWQVTPVGNTTKAARFHDHDDAVAAAREVADLAEEAILAKVAAMESEHRLGLWYAQHRKEPDVTTD